MAPFRVTARQREALEAMAAVGGDRAAAAARLGVSTRSLARLLENARGRTGALTNFELALMYGREDLQLVAFDAEPVRA